MATHTLILLRHGKSDWSANVEDFERPLNKRGEDSVPKMGKRLKKHGPVPDLIIASPAERAWRTAVLMAQALGLKESGVIADDRIYGNNLSELKAVIDSRCSGSRCAMIVGHNPALDELLSHLSSTPPPRNEPWRCWITATGPSAAPPAARY